MGGIPAHVLDHGGPTTPQASVHLVQGAGRIHEVLERGLADDQVERLGWQGHARRVARNEVDAHPRLPGVLTCDPDERPADVQTGHVKSAESGHLDGEVPRPWGHLEHIRAGRQVLGELQSLPPVCAALALIVRAMGRPLLGEGWRRRLIPFALLGITGGLLPWAAIAWGEERISSGLASILNSTTPLWTAVLVYWVIPSDRPSPLNYAGLLIGLVGVVILVVPDLAAKGLGGNAVGAVAVVLASLSYAVNALYQRRRMRGVSVYEVALGQLAATAVFSIPFAGPALPSVHVALPSLAAVVALGVGGSGIALLLYFYIMNTLGPVRATGV